MGPHRKANSFKVFLLFLLRLFLILDIRSGNALETKQDLYCLPLCSMYLKNAKKDFFCFSFDLWNWPEMELISGNLEVPVYVKIVILKITNNWILFGTKL